MKEKISAAVKTTYSKFGLKAATIEKLTNIIESRLAAMGVIEPERLDGVIATVVAEQEPFIGLIQSEVDSRVHTPTPPAPPVPPVNPPVPTGNDDLKAILEKQQKEFDDFKALISNRDKAEKNQHRLATIGNVMKAKGCTKEPVLQVVLSGLTLDDAATDDSIVTNAMPIYEAKMKEFYGDAYVPHIPEADKTKITAAGQERLKKNIGKTVEQMGTNLAAPKQD